MLATFWTKTSLVHINSIWFMIKYGLRVKEGVVVIILVPFTPPFGHEASHLLKLS
ncbi:hypothetical protein PRUPE_2G065400 [Prunus persica]|uniref:Uncharacterized protein n=1 Tax=Prunus persica TaxID=3760 RepID=A0A251QCD3_PRUPE|nr:hypothetical protein PRUPE_2G065400 [Prunus persica]